MIEILYFDKKVKKGKVEDISKLRNKKIWLDITKATKEETELLKKEFGLHPLTAEDLHNTPTRIKVEEFPNYLFCVFYGILEGKEIELVEIDFIIGEKFLITNHKNLLSSFSAIKGNPELLERLLSKGMDFLFHKLLDNEIDNFAPSLENIDDQIENLEEKIAKNPKPEILQKILKIKRKIIKLKKIAFPQREKISFLAKNEYNFISKKAIPYFRDIHDHSIRASDSIDNYREAIGNAFDVYMSAVSNNMNEVMKVLSIIATLALPLSVISGIYGTNFINLPGSAASYGFWVMISGMVLLCLVMLTFFKRRRWF